MSALAIYPNEFIRPRRHAHLFSNYLPSSHGDALRRAQICRRASNLSAPLDSFGSIYKPNMTLEEGIECMKKCFKEINTRFMIGGATFTLKVCPPLLTSVLSSSQSLRFTTASAT